MEKDKPVNLDDERKKRRQLVSRVRAYLNIDGQREKIFDSKEQDKPPDKGET